MNTNNNPPSSSSSSSSSSSIVHPPPPPCRAISPPTPAPSPQPNSDKDQIWAINSANYPLHQPHPLIPFNYSPDPPDVLLHAFGSLSLAHRSKFLNSLLPILNLNELTNLSAKILPRLKRDFLRELPIEISLHILSFVDDPKTLMRAGMVSRFWRSLVSDEATWKGMCSKRGFNNGSQPIIIPLSLSERMEKERKGRVATYRAGVEERRRRIKSNSSSNRFDQAPPLPSLPSHQPPQLIPETAHPSASLQQPPLPQDHPHPSLSSSLGISCRSDPNPNPNHHHHHHPTTDPTTITTTALGLGPTSTTTSSNRFGSNHPSHPLHPSGSSTPSLNGPHQDPILAPYLSTTADPHLSLLHRSNQLPISRRNSFNDILTSPRLDQRLNELQTHHPSSSTSSRTLSTIHHHPIPHLIQRPSPLSSHPFSLQAPDHDHHLIKQPHKVINANSPQPGMMAPTDATSPHRTRPHSMPILGLSLNLTRSLSAFPDLNHDSIHSSVSNAGHHPTHPESSDEPIAGSSHSYTTSYIPDHPDSQAWTPSSLGAHDLPSQPPTGSSSAYDELDYSPKTPFSYKSYFKRAYLTESNWLRGPGELLAMQTSQNNDGHEWVVTSLGFDDDWIVVGMATSKIHVFSAHTGQFVRTLVGHELGVWCLALVSKGGMRDPRDPSPENCKGKGHDKSYNMDDSDDYSSYERDHAASMSIGLLPSHHTPSSSEWISSAGYHPSIPFNHGVSMVRARGGLGMDTWRRDRHDSQQTTVQANLAPSTDDVGSIFQPASADMTLETHHHPSAHQLPTRTSTAFGGASSTEEHQPQPAPSSTFPSVAVLAPPPTSFARISGARLPSADPNSTLSDADPPPRQQSGIAGSRVSFNQTDSGHGARSSRMSPLAFDYRRPRRPTSFGSYTSTHVHTHSEEYPPRSSSHHHHHHHHQSQSMFTSAPGGMGLGAGGPSAGSLQQASACGVARGWGQKSSLVVSGGCDRDVRVWDVTNGRCKFVLHGHSSTIRCLKVLDGRPIAVSGSRDSSLRVWDIERGVQKHVLVGHSSSVRAIEVHGNRIVSGSYDTTCRLWDVDTGECLKVLRGHYHQIYAVAFDGQRIASGSMDSTVCIWSAQTGELIALLQGHTALVGQVQINGRSNVLVTGGSDGRVVIFSLDSFECVHRLCAHDNSVTCLQFDDRFVVTGGNDGRVKLWDFKTGAFIRELAEPCEAVWRITLRDDKAVLLCKRDGKTVMELISFRPSSFD